MILEWVYRFDFISSRLAFLSLQFFVFLVFRRKKKYCDLVCFVLNFILWFFNSIAFLCIDMHVDPNFDYFLWKNQWKYWSEKKINANWNRLIGLFVVFSLISSRQSLRKNKMIQAKGEKKTNIFSSFLEW